MTKEPESLRKSNDTLQAIRSNAENIIWPPVATGVAATLAALLHHFEESQWLPHDIITQRQYDQLAVLAVYAEKQSPYFRQRLEQTGARTQNIASPEGLRQLPILTRSDIQQAGDTLHCKEIPKSHMPVGEGKSSGSTGEPVTVRKTAINDLFWHANMMREHFWHHRDFSGRLLVMRSGIKAPIRQKGWGRAVDLLFSSGPTIGLPILLDIKELVKVLLEFKPQQLNIYPSTLDALITHCQKENISIEGVEHIWCISETLSSGLRQRAKEFFNASIEDDYSSNEIGIIALQCPDSGLYHVMSESVIVEVLDEEGNPCAEGQIGKILVTSLLNFATPLIRYDIGDYAERGGPCPCGRGLPTLKAIKGRTRNLVVKPDGSRHWPPLPRAIFLSKLRITQFQFIQHSLEDIEVRLVTDAKLTAAEEATLTEHVHQALGHPFNLRFIYFDGRLPLPPNGKFEDFICRI
jgi:phenylacetate-CoA ligase